MFGVAVASLKITENIDNGSKFNSIGLDQTCNWYAIHTLTENKKSK